MNKLILPILICISQLVFSQSPMLMSYQAVVRNAQNQLVQNSPVGLKISILQGSASGNEIFSETHLVSTNENGLISLEIGNGQLISGDISQIPWSSNQYWLKSSVDIEGGTNYSLITVSQFLTVPYSFHATYSDSTGSGIQNLVDNGNGTLTFQYNNGSSYTTAPLSGLQGQAGENGLSAYQIWLNNGHTGTETQFLDSIKGVPGTNGENGLHGTNGVSITNTVIQNDSLIVTLSNGQTLNAGYLNCPGQNAFLPSVETVGVSNIGSNKVTLTYKPLSNGNELILAGGFCYSTMPNPTINDKKVTHISNFEINKEYPLEYNSSVNNISNLLLPNTQYYVKSFITNVKGTSYGNELSFTTLPACLQPQTYSCNVNITFNYDDNGQMLTYYNDVVGTLIINNDYSYSINFEDPNSPQNYCVAYSSSGYFINNSLEAITSQFCNNSYFQTPITMNQNCNGFLIFIDNNPFIYVNVTF